MQAQYLGDGVASDYTASGTVAAGDVVVTNGLIQISNRKLVSGDFASLQNFGLFRGVKDSSNVSHGNALYWDADGDPVGGTAGTGAFTTTSSGNTFAGYAVAAAGVSAETVDFVLIHVPSTLITNNAVTQLIADPGNAGAIPVTKSGYCPIVTAGSETRTLAAPTFIGQELLLYVKTDGGTCVITVASAINQTGNNTITMADVRDVIRLVAIESGSSKVWHVVSNDGAALSTV